MKLFSIIATLLFILCVHATGLGLEWYVEWNMQNLPCVVLLLYPRMEKLWRWLRFWLYA